MARNFVNASQQTLLHSAAPVTDWPFTYAFWAKASSAATNRFFFSLANAGATYAVDCYRAAAGPLHWYVTTASANADINTAVDPGNDTWFHGAFVGTSDTARAVYCNGTKVTDTTNININSGGTLDHVRLGWTIRGDATHYLTGDMAEAAIWNAALADDDIAALSKGFAPPLIQPGSLVAYWPIGGNLSPEPDRSRNAYHLTLGNTPAKSDHPRIYNPFVPMVDHA